MIRSLLVCSLALVLAATSANAGLDLAWNACNTNGGQLVHFFDCAGGAPSVLYGSWQIPVNQDSVVSIEGALDLTTQTNPMSSFWHFESCNSGYEISHVRPGSGCGGSFNAWAPSGSGESISFLPPGSPTVPLGGNRGRWVFTVFRPSSTPANVPAARNNFGFELKFLMDAAAERGGTCAGCADAANIRWISALLGNVRGGGQPYSISGAGLTTDCVNVNTQTPCIIDPVRNTTWGQIKSFYH